MTKMNSDPKVLRVPPSFLNTSFLIPTAQADCLLCHIHVSSSVWQPGQVVFMFACRRCSTDNGQLAVDQENATAVTPVMINPRILVYAVQREDIVRGQIISRILSGDQS
jgi:hypothetical protein